MPPREGESQERIHIWLYKSDVEWLRNTFGGSLGLSKPVRLMVRKFRENTEAKAAQSTAPSSALKEALNDID